MNNYIVIHGVVLWVFLAIFLLAVFGFAAYGKLYFESLRDKDRLKLRIKILRRENEEIRTDYSKLMYEYFRETKKVPERGGEDNGND